MQPQATGVSRYLVHCTIIACYAIFGGGSLVSKFGMFGTSPLLFELVRELCTTAILWQVLVFIQCQALPDRRHVTSVLLTGVMFFCNQACFFTGLKLADPISAATWQASVPCFTAAVCATLGVEFFTWRKACGTVLASAGAALMALLGTGPNVRSAFGGNPEIYGHIIFFFGVISIPGYILKTKTLIRDYTAIAITTWSFTVSTVLMAAVTTIISFTPALLELFCYDDDEIVAKLCEKTPWRMPSGMWLPVAYEVLLCSVLAWSALAWATRHVKPSVLSLYSVTQPLASAVFSLIVVNSGSGGPAGIQAPGYRHALAAGLIMTGLVMTLHGTDKEAAECMRIRQLDCEKTMRTTLHPSDKKFKFYA